MRVGVIVLCVISLLVLVNGHVLSCSKCAKNECDCKRKVLKATVPGPPDFESTKHCEKVKPTHLKPVKDICSCKDVAHVRPHQSEACEPKFAPSTSCECGYDETKPPAPKKYPADVISKHLAAIAARKKAISETELHFHGPPVKVPPSSKPEKRIPEELLHKLNRQPLELLPQKKKHALKLDTTEEDHHHSCEPEKQYYSEICYGKVDHPNPPFVHIKPEEVHGPEAPCHDGVPSKETSESEEEDDDSEEGPPEKPKYEENEDCSSPEEEHCSSLEDSPEELDDSDSHEEEDEEPKKRSIDIPLKTDKRQKHVKGSSYKNH